MSGLLRSAWRSLFPRLQRSLPAHHGHPLLARLDRAAMVFHNLYDNGHYDPATNGEAWLLRQLAPLQPRVILDVGANRGEYAELALQVCPEAQVHAFEPMPAVFPQLQSALGHHPRATLHQLALADQEGDLRFWFDPSKTGNTSAVPGVQSAIHGLKAPEPITAAGLRLDQFCERNGIEQIDLLKIDTEGFEASVLRGGGELLSSGAIACIQIEYGKANLFSRYFIHDYMSDYGETYQIGKLYPRGVRWFGSYGVDLDDLMGPNLVMAHRDRADLIGSLGAML
jgi:FkbM family methyltransferase